MVIKQVWVSGKSVFRSKAGALQHMTALRDRVVGRATQRGNKQPTELAITDTRISFEWFIPYNRGMYKMELVDLQR